MRDQRTFEAVASRPCRGGPGPRDGFWYLLRLCSADRTVELLQVAVPKVTGMLDAELSNAVLLCDEPNVEAILGRDRSRALATDEQGRTLLMSAVSMGPQANGVSLPILGRLLDAGLDINALDHDGCTALRWPWGNAPPRSCGSCSLAVPIPTGQPADSWPLERWDQSRRPGGPARRGCRPPRPGDRRDECALEWAEEGGDEDLIRVLSRAVRRGREAGCLPAPHRPRPAAARCRRTHTHSRRTGPPSSGPDSAESLRLFDEGEVFRHSGATRPFARGPFPFGAGRSSAVPPVRVRGHRGRSRPIRSRRPGAKRAQA